MKRPNRVRISEYSYPESDIMNAFINDDYYSRYARLYARNQEPFLDLINSRLDELMQEVQELFDEMIANNKNNE